MSETRIVPLPPCSFEDFLNHMSEADAAEWTWSFIEMCSRFGIFHSCPRGTILARPVNGAIPQADLLEFNDIDPEHALASSGLTDQHDTWHVLYASGDPSFFFNLCPYDLEFISWHRNKGNKRLKTHKFKKIREKFHG